MPRYRLVVEYDGTPFSGWQHQRNGRSVQEALEAAIARFSAETVRVHCAGRTDAGVHATYQVVHLDLARAWPTDTIRDATNAHLRPDPVAVVSAAEASPGFHARLSATKRHYLYRILARRAPPALDRNRVWHLPWRLDPTIMQAAARRLVGRHDFTTFRAAECQAASPLRTLERLDVFGEGEEILIRAAARSFLHSQVRSMVGTIAMAAGGRWSVDDVEAALEARDRARCGPLAPPHGLALVGVEYGSSGPLVSS